MFTCRSNIGKDYALAPFLVRLRRSLSNSVIVVMVDYENHEAAGLHYLHPSPPLHHFSWLAAHQPRSRDNVSCRPQVRGWPVKELQKDAIRIQAPASTWIRAQLMLRFNWSEPKSLSDIATGSYHCRKRMQTPRLLQDTITMRILKPLQLSTVQVGTEQKS
jgi:hypothetical protein